MTECKQNRHSFSGLEHRCTYPGLIETKTTIQTIVRISIGPISVIQIYALKSRFRSWTSLILISYPVSQKVHSLTISRHQATRPALKQPGYEMEAPWGANDQPQRGFHLVAGGFPSLRRPDCYPNKFSSFLSRTSKLCKPAWRLDSTNIWVITKITKKKRLSFVGLESRCQSPAKAQQNYPDPRSG